ncbi:hypothetical protein SKAU_G00153580 [Synaphobranchus kaupii]|uniref:Uncharacterized protein n=1 Tax=Synaphobranchus kaupii TaxID=118154 RepID=A0A9Q1IYN8_SYNKA|nr:hypothetical protein SKAU_G00153580 [Synaphobranchus kaupii]
MQPMRVLTPILWPRGRTAMEVKKVPALQEDAQLTQASLRRSGSRLHLPGKLSNEWLNRWSCNVYASPHNPVDQWEHGKHTMSHTHTEAGR